MGDGGVGWQMLGSLGVQKLVLPAVATVGGTWTGAFGFRATEESERRQLAEMGILVFPGTQTLEKALVNTGNRLHLPLPERGSDEGDAHLSWGGGRCAFQGRLSQTLCLEPL